jgi:hypothetical protein
MAIVGTDRGTGTHNTSATSFTLSPGSNFAAGTWAVLCIAADNSVSGGATENFTSVTDSLGNVWVERNTAVYDPGTASSGVQGAFYTTNQNAGLLTTGTVITVTFGAATVAKAWTLSQVAPSAGFCIQFSSSGDGTGSATNAPTVTTSSITSGDMVVGACFNEQGTGQAVTGDADTTNGTWSTQQVAEVGTTAAGMTVASQYKVVTATATQTYDPTLSVSSDVINAWISLTETAIPKRSGFVANAQSNAAIGAVAIWGASLPTATVAPAEQPTPQAAQWANASRDTTQAQPWFSRVAAAPAVASPNGQFLFIRQDRPEQVQPNFVGQSAGQRVVPPPRPAIAIAPQEDTSQSQPRFDRQQLAAAVVASQPTRPLFAGPLEDPAQSQPWFARQQAAPASIAEPRRALISAAPQEDITQPQPWFGKQVPPSAATESPAIRPWSAQPQTDPTQVQPWRSAQQLETTAQPTPQAAQWGFASRDTTQVQPWFGKATLPSAAPPSPPPLRAAWFASSQANPTQLQPAIWRMQVDFVAIAAATGTVSAPQVEPNRQPWFSKAIFAPVAQPRPVTKFIGAAPQTDPTQVQPEFAGQQPPSAATEAPPQRTLAVAAPQANPAQVQPWFSRQAIPSAAVAAPMGRPWFAAPQNDPAHLAPRVWGMQIDFVSIAASAGTLSSPQTEQDRQPWFSKQPPPTAVIAAPPPFTWSASPQADPTQIQPWRQSQVPPSQATQAPPSKAFFAAPQDDPTQIQPRFAALAFIESQVAPPVVAPTPSAGSWLGPRKKKIKAKAIKPAKDLPPFELRELAKATKQLPVELRKIVVALPPKAKPPALLAEPTQQPADQLAKKPELIRSKPAQLIRSPTLADALVLIADLTERVRALERATK